MDYELYRKNLKIIIGEKWYNKISEFMEKAFETDSDYYIFPNPDEILLAKTIMGDKIKSKNCISFSDFINLIKENPEICTKIYSEEVKINFILVVTLSFREMALNYHEFSGYLFGAAIKDAQKKILEMQERRNKIQEQALNDKTREELDKYLRFNKQLCHSMDLTSVTQQEFLLLIAKIPWNLFIAYEIATPSGVIDEYLVNKVLVPKQSPLALTLDYRLNQFYNLNLETTLVPSEKILKKVEDLVFFEYFNKIRRFMQLIGFRKDPGKEAFLEAINMNFKFSDFVKNYNEINGTFYSETDLMPYIKNLESRGYVVINRDAISLKNVCFDILAKRYYEFLPIIIPIDGTEEYSRVYKTFKSYLCALKNSGYNLTENIDDIAANLTKINFLLYLHMPFERDRYLTFRFWRTFKLDKNGIAVQQVEIEESKEKLSDYNQEQFQRFSYGQGIKEKEINLKKK